MSVFLNGLRRRLQQDGAISFIRGRNHNECVDTQLALMSLYLFMEGSFILNEIEMTWTDREALCNNKTT